MSDENRRWLAQQLPDLISAKVIDQLASERLSQHFSLDDLPDDNAISKATILLAAIGGLLIGGGIIMLFAHNWDSLSRPIRAVLGVLPLLLSQALVLMGLFPKERGIAWREASAAFMFCAVPASIALVGQTYHISSDEQAFLTMWFVLLLPFVYLLRARLTAVLLMVLAVTLCGSYQSWYWLCIVAMLPFYFLAKPYGQNAQDVRIGWVFAIATTVAISGHLLSLSNQYDQIMLLLFMSGAVLIYLLGSFNEIQFQFWKRPFSNVGAVLIALNLLIYTHTDAWPDKRSSFAFDDVNSLSIFLVICAVIGLFVMLWRRRNDLLPLASMWFFTLAITLLSFGSANSMPFVITANIAAFGLGVWYLLYGMKSGSGSRLNFGLILIMSLILLRFFDQDVSFIVRGLVFIGMGVALVSVNVWHNRRGEFQRGQA